MPPRKGRADDKAKLDSTVEAANGISVGNLSNHIGYLLRRAQVAVFQDFVRTLGKLDIRPSQFGILSVIEANPGLKQSQVSSALGMQRTNFVIVFDELERRGLAERVSIASDRRSYALHLTDAGRTLMRQAEKALEAHQRRLKDKLGEDGCARLLAMLSSLAEL